MGPETYYELTRRSVPIIKNEKGYLSWRNSVLFIQTSKRLNFFEFTNNLECLERNIDLKESSILSPKNSPATELCGNCKFLKSEMRNGDYTEMIANSSYWPHNPALTQEMTTVLMCKWSPRNFIRSDCVLAILNNIGGIELYGLKQSQWKCILDFSPYILKVLKYNKTPAYFDELKESVHIVETSAICWARELNSDNSCYFVTAQKNGTILVWQIFKDLNTVKLQGRIESKMKDISALKWIPKSESNKFFIISTDVSGQINAYDLQIKNERLILEQMHPLWPHNDRMIAVNLKFSSINNRIVFVCSKHRYLLVQVLDENGAILGQYLKNVNDHRITDIAYTTEGFYISTVNIKIYTLNISFVQSNLNVDLVQLDLKDQYSTYELYGLRFSTNNVVCALAMANRRVMCRKEAHKMEIFFLSSDSKMESVVPTLLKNPTQKLTDYRDCVELLRVEIYKLKRIPKFDYKELYDAASQDIYKLKLYFILMTYFNCIRKLLRVCSVTLPETSTELVKEKILVQYAQALLCSLCNKCQEEGNLSDLDMESLYGSKKYLEYYSKKYKTEIDFDRNVLNALENNCEYVCQCCDDKLEGFSCKSGHLNMFCMITFTPILGDDYLLCRCCGCTARADLNVVNPTCVFCDLYLVKPD